MDHIFGFIGLGLIGGSIAKGIKHSLPSAEIMAYMRTREKLEQAHADGVVDVILDGVSEPLRECDIIFLCAPVENNRRYLEEVKPFIRPGAILTDTGSTKSDIHRVVKQLGMEDCFIGSHPMAGSEKSGYENSSDRLLENAYYIITPCEKTKQEDIFRMVTVAHLIGSIPIVLDYEKHDRIVAAISHLPHLIASSLVNLVHDHDSADEMMKMLAAGGFKDITRIASSDPAMWEQICMTNTDNISEILKDYIASLEDILRELEDHNGKAINDLFDSSRSYRDTFSNISQGSLIPDYTFSVDVADEPGAISVCSSILSSRGINIRNIGINNIRDHGEGAMQVSFYDKASMDAAWELLTRYNYRLIRVN